MDLVWCWEKLARFLWADTESAAETGAGQSSPLSLRLSSPTEEAPHVQGLLLEECIENNLLEW